MVDRWKCLSKGRECTKESLFTYDFPLTCKEIRLLVDFREIGADNTNPVTCKTTQAKSPKMSLIAFHVLMVVLKE